MPIAQEELLSLLQAAFPEGDVRVIDLAGDNDHYEVHVASAQFVGLAMLAQHKLVYAALGARVGGQIHALSVKTKIK